MYAEKIQLLSVRDDTPVNCHRSAKYRELHKPSHLADAVQSLLNAEGCPLASM